MHIVLCSIPGSIMFALCIQNPASHNDTCGVVHFVQIESPCVLSLSQPGIFCTLFCEPYAWCEPASCCDVCFVQTWCSHHPWPSWHWQDHHCCGSDTSVCQDGEEGVYTLGVKCAGTCRMGRQLENVILIAEHISARLWIGDLFSQSTYVRTCVCMWWVTLRNVTRNVVTYHRYRP